MQIRGNARRLSWVRSRVLLTALVAAGIMQFASAPRAQAPVAATTPFDVIGFIQAATVDNPTDVFSGGTITVNNQKFIVPRNTILQMPATALTWQEVFKLAPAPYGPTQTGMALTDVPAPTTTYEIHIQGNRVISGGTDTYIAGLLFMAQQSLNVGAGFINSINYATGEMRVGGVIGSTTTGARVAINDPIKRFRHTAAAVSPDVRFTIDEDNPTVRSGTAYPMCIPASAAGDPECPTVNRPKDPVTGQFLTIFTMDPPGVGPTDPTKMAPFEVGDYVTYNGNLMTDANGPYVAAWSVIANVGIFTAPGLQPAYVAIDVMLLGVGGVPLPGLPQEAAIRTRVEGFTTDPSNTVDVFAVDVDPCTGNESERFYADVAVEQVAPLGRFRWRPNTLFDFLPPTREMRIISQTGVVPAPLPNGLVPGMYTAPNFTFIFPENLAIGNPPVPSNFQDFPFLQAGSGPYFGGGPTPSANSLGTVGQLSPWPGAVAPQPVVCSATNGTVTAKSAPIANAGPGQTVASAPPPAAPVTVTLDGSGSIDSNTPPLPLSFLWTQKSGTAVTLVGATTPRPRFTAPTVPLNGANLTLVFTLKVTNTVGLSSTADVTITIGNKQPAVDTITITTATFSIRRSILTVNATTTNTSAILTLQGFGVMQAADAAGLPVVGGTSVAVPGSFQLLIVGLRPQPTTVTVTSNLGASTTIPVTVVP